MRGLILHELDGDQIAGEQPGHPELRTPLAIISGYSELALSQPASEDPAAVRHALRRVGGEAGRMSELVDDLLTLPRLEAAPAPHAEALDLSVLAVKLGAHATAAHHVWRLSIPDEPVTVLSDRRALRRMLLKVIANAASHTPAGTTVVISLSVDRDRDEAVIAVSDDGPGIPRRTCRMSSTDSGGQAAARIMAAGSGWPSSRRPPARTAGRSRSAAPLVPPPSARSWLCGAAADWAAASPRPRSGSSRRQRSPPLGPIQPRAPAAGQMTAWLTVTSCSGHETGAGWALGSVHPQPSTGQCAPGH